MLVALRKTMMSKVSLCFALVGALCLWWVWVPLLFVIAPVAFVIAKYTPFGGPINAVYYRLYDWLFYQSEAPRKFLWQKWYNILCWLYPQQYWTCMNYGYSPLDEAEGKLIDLKEGDERERFCVQLYHHVATGTNDKLKSLKGKKVLEVGCGRGGGLSYVTRYLNPESSTGLDYSQTQVDFCKKNYADLEKMSFCQGDAENLPFPDNSFDLVINVESSHCYGNFRRFVSEVTRVLKPGGQFCFTDFRDHTEVAELKEAITHTNLVLEKEENVTPNVLKALELDGKRRISLIKSFVHPVLQNLFIKFSGLKGSRINDAMEQGETLYLVYILKK